MAFGFYLERRNQRARLHIVMKKLLFARIAVTSGMLSLTTFSWRRWNNPSASFHFAPVGGFMAASMAVEESSVFYFSIIACMGQLLIAS